MEWYPGTRLRKSSTIKVGVSWFKNIKTVFQGELEDREDVEVNILDMKDGKIED